MISTLPKVCRQRVVDQDLSVASPRPWVTPKGNSRHRSWPFSETVHFCCVRGIQFTTPFTPATSYATPNVKPELCDSRLRLGKLGSRGFLRASCGCTLNLGSKGENLVLGTASPGQITTTRSGLPSKPLSYSHTPLYFPRHPVVLGSFASLIHQPDVPE